jgi:molybdenum cofactor synthesis domain-containing protein
MRRALVITVSDRSAEGVREDASGPAAVEKLTGMGFECADPVIVADEIPAIGAALRAGIKERFDLIVTTGGTGLSARDVTPEATLEVVTKLVPGLAELMRAEGLKATPTAVLSRAMAGVAGETLIMNLPGSPRGVTESLDAVKEVLPHALDVLRGSGSH